VEIFINLKRILKCMVYETIVKEKYVGTEKSDVHSWRPPCSCGVELNSSLIASIVAPIVKEQGSVHSWRPPCSCGVSLNDIVDK
jgi:hypothetical protein